MKKIKKILFMFLLAIPVIVKADADAPMLNYKVRVNNPEGAYLYKYDSEKKEYIKSNDKVEYDKIVKISYEMKIGNQVYGGYVCSDEAGRNCGYINLANTSTIDINLEDYKSDFALNYRVFDDTCYLYEGPSANAYKKISPETKLNVGYTFSSNYFDDMWIYVPEKQAWVYRRDLKNDDMEPSGMIEISGRNKTKLLTLKEVKIYDNPKTKSNVLATIPANTEITATTSYNIERRKPFYYVTYNGVTGFIESIRDNDDISTINVAIGTFDGKVTVTNKGGTKLYKGFDTNSEVIATIPENTELELNYELHNFLAPIMYKVEYNNLTGWILAEEVTWKNPYEPQNNENNENENTPTEELNELEENTEPETITPESESNQLSTKGAITLCIVVVALTSLTAFVTIILINKKKKQKNVETNTDNIN